MDALDSLVEVEAIRRLLVRYGQLLDDGDFVRWGALFVDDACFRSFPGAHLPGGPDAAALIGRDAIVAGVEATQRALRRDGALLHFGGAPLIEIDGDSAQAQWDFLVIQARAEAHHVAFAGRYHADLRKDARVGWRFVQRTSLAIGHQPPSIQRNV